MTPPMTPREKVAAFLKERDEACGVIDADDVERDESASLIITALASGSGDHAELARLAEAATPGPWFAWIKSRTLQIDTRGGDGRLPAIINWPGFDGNDMSHGASKANARFIAAANPATVLSLLSEIAALRAMVENAADGSMGQTDKLLTMHERATQAERQRDELLNAWRDDGIDLEDFGRIVARLANQGAEPAPVKKERAWICPQDNTPCPPECDSDDRRHCASVACREQPE